MLCTTLEHNNIVYKKNVIDKMLSPHLFLFHFVESLSLLVKIALVEDYTLLYESHLEPDTVL